MSSPAPVYTVRAECQDCYRCVRECVPKAIRVHEGHAEVVPDRCVKCGHCVAVCPVGAKRIRGDVARAQALLLSGRPVVASVAPSFVSAFPDIEPERFIGALVELGFTAASETALGADHVTRAVAAELEQAEAPVISTACPAVVALAETYFPDAARRLSTCASPMEVHARLVRAHWGNDAQVVFIGPCAAKKHEAERSNGLVPVALTFEELALWFSAAHVDLTRPGPRRAFEPHRAARGTGYPAEGGMIEAIGAGSGRAAVAVSGMAAVTGAFAEIEADPTDEPLFLELLACRGGCVQGPGHPRHSGELKRRAGVRRWAASAPECSGQPVLQVVTDRAIGTGRASGTAPETRIETALPDAIVLRNALAKVGKRSESDELNCAGCGYDSCREFAAAMIDGRAEHTMCVSHTRTVAQKKADALVRAMPSGVVILDRDLRIRECNARFAALLGEEAELLNEAHPGLPGVDARRVVPFWREFEQALTTGADRLGADIRLDGRIINGSIFVVEADLLVGGVFQDVTTPSMQRDRIVAQTEEVIRRNLSTVQQIASLLGENAAETEAILGSIMEAFGAAAE